tara:strand:- start:2123 stop:2503 length:381 start_codon:yes stop_codon:yes gene_type:complete
MKSFTEWHNDDEVNEALSISQRRAVGRRMKRMKTRIARGKKIKQRRMADRTQLQKRASLMARNILTKKLSGGKQKADLNVAQKIAVAKKLEGKKNAIRTLVRKLMPRVKKAERERLNKFRSKSSDN